LADENASAASRAAPNWVIIMPLHLERVQWMPSPPLVPDDGPIDMGHLRQMTLGDAGLEHEVLAMFAAQASDLIERIVRLQPNAGELAHKLKGSAQAVGAFRIAEAAEWLIDMLREGRDNGEALMTLTDAVLEARSEIDGHLNRS
jgi:HPt (histidine-containing phosphotransfer) domain-containing protein